MKANTILKSIKKQFAHKVSKIKLARRRTAINTMKVEGIKYKK